MSDLTEPHHSHEPITSTECHVSPPLLISQDSMTVRRLLMVFGGLSCYGLDYIIKRWVWYGMTYGDSVPIWRDVFHITYAENTGMAFGMMHNHPQVLLWLTSMLFGILLVFALAKPKLSDLEVAAFALILGGAAGNITDRFLYNVVIDYFDFTLINYPIFNLADTWIFLGVVLLLWAYWRNEDDSIIDRLDIPGD